MPTTPRGTPAWRWCEVEEQTGCPPTACGEGLDLIISRTRGLGHVGLTDLDYQQIPRQRQGATMLRTKSPKTQMPASCRSRFQHFWDGDLRTTPAAGWFGASTRLCSVESEMILSSMTRQNR
jgi:hypothetical protein